LFVFAVGHPARRFPDLRGNVRHQSLLLHSVVSA
jgi:hypothetical protein